MQQDAPIPKDPVNNARYIAAMAKELQLVALRSDLGMLNYLLGLVVLEADLLAKGKVAGE